MLTGRNRHLWPREARDQMLPEILDFAQHVVSGQIIEIAIENPTIKGRKGNLLLDICLQEITVWMKRTMWVCFIPPSAGKCFVCDRQYKKREICFSFFGQK